MKLILCKIDSFGAAKQTCILVKFKFLSVIKLVLKLLSASSSEHGGEGCAGDGAEAKEAGSGTVQRES
jgi:hypothetical protein